MRHTQKIARLLPVAAMLVAAEGLAQDTMDRRDRTREPQDATRRVTPMERAGDRSAAARPASVIKSSDIIGADVTNEQGEDLGNVDELMIDTDRGRVAYAVLSFGGFMGVGDKLFALPWESLTAAPGTNQFYLNVDKAQLKNAPGFDKDNWPDMANEQWNRDIYTHYQRDPYWENEGNWDREPGDGVDRKLGANNDQMTGQPRRDMDRDGGIGREPGDGVDRKLGRDNDVRTAPGERGMDRDRDMNRRVPADRNAVMAFNLAKASDLVGADVENLQDEDLGEIDALAIDSTGGRVTYAVVGVGGFLGIGEQMIAVPWSALRRGDEADQFVLDIDRERLEAAPRFARNQWPDMNDRTWGEPVHRYYGVDPYWDLDNWDREPGDGIDRKLGANNDVRTGRRSLGWGRDDQYWTMYNRDRERSITGTVTRIDRASPMGEMSEGLQATLRTEQGETMIVNLGPAWYLDNQDIEIRQNDRLEVKGSTATIAGKQVFIASEIEKDGDTLRLRHEDGTPAWSGWKRR